ncbi:MAG: MFS transporter [Candidatus Competibacteraceae bacterium]|nr:MFS transporter [Candidatus Competibacteraceae bacterium]
MTRERPSNPALPSSSPRTHLIPLTSITLLLLLLPLLGVSYYALVAFERELLPEIEQKALRVGLSVDGEIRRAVDFGIPFTKLEGMDQFFAAKLEAAQDLAYIAVTARDGTILYQQGRLDANRRATLAAETADVLAAGTAIGKLSPQYRLPAALAALSGERPTAPVLPADGDSYRIALPVSARGADGVIHLGIDARIVTRQVEAIVLDIAIVLLVAILAAFELLLLVAVSGVAEPLRQLDALLRRLGRGDFSQALPETARARLGRLGRALDAQIERVNAGYRAVSRLRVAARATGRGEPHPVALTADSRAGAIFAGGSNPDRHRAPDLVPIRAAAFLFVFAEELALPFFPLYVRELTPPADGWSPDWPAAWAISTFMAALALAAPLAGAWSKRVGPRSLFLLGAALSTAGLSGAGLAGDYGALLLWRAVSALGYALALAACQRHLFDSTGPENRAQGAATLAGGIAAASVCGPAIGGMLAEGIGYGATFAAGAALAVASALLAARFIPRPAPSPQAPNGDARRLPPEKPAAKRFGNARFLILAVFAAAPAKLLLVGFLFFLAPALLAERGASVSEIGRALMGYGIAVAVCAPLCARLLQRWNMPGLAVGMGCTLAGLALLPVLFAPGTPAVLLAAVGLGVGQALIGPAQAPLLAQVSRDAIAARGERSVTHHYRLIECLGAALGPLVAAFCASAFGYAGAALALGALGTVSAALFSAAFLILGATPEDDAAAPVASTEETVPCSL